MKKLLNFISCMALCIGLLPWNANAARMLIPGGQAIGLELQDNTVTVAAFDDALGASAREAGLQPGDKLTSIDRRPITSAEDVRDALARSDGSVVLGVERGSKKMQLRVSPAITQEGPRLGVYLRQGMTGIGTVTWYDPEDGTFGTLGHGISDGKGSLIGMKSGNAYSASILSVKKGKAGEPGQLQGAIEETGILGALSRNTEQGVFGSAAARSGEAVETASLSQVHTGKAVIRSTVSGTAVREYSVEILKIYPKSRDSGRNFLLRVTDPSLLEATGGIVQGMSGSPILQDGKLIGAVTHVLVNDPTTGYGIGIDNMLEAAA